MTIVWCWNTVRKSSHISFFCGGALFCEVVRRPENTYDLLPWVTRRSLPSLERLVDLSLLLERPADLCLQSKITDLILSFQVLCESMNILFASRIFLFMAVYRNLRTSVFFSVIWWSSLRTEISVTQSIGNKLYSSPSWCSRYRRRNWTRRYEFKSSTRLIAFHIALIPLGKVGIQLFSLQ